MGARLKSISSETFKGGVSSYNRVSHLLGRKITKRNRLFLMVSIIAGITFLLAYMPKGLSTNTTVTTIIQENSTDTSLDAEKLLFPERFSDKHAKIEKYKLFKEVLNQVKEYSKTSSTNLHLAKSCQDLNIGVVDTKKFQLLTKEALQTCVDLSTTNISLIASNHAEYKKHMLGTLLPSFGKLHMDIYENYGVVILGGLNRTVAALTVVNSIRKNPGIMTSNKLPIEIIIPLRSEEEEYVCEELLHTIDHANLSTCVFLEDIFGNELMAEITPQLYRPLSLLVSSFSRLLYLDSTTYPVASLDEYFFSNIFNELGLVFWPSTTRRTHHPKLYEILGIGLDMHDRDRNSIDDVFPKEFYTLPDNPTPYPFHDIKNTIPDMSTDASVLLFDKGRNLDILLMALYYNLNGPSTYYPLLGQPLNSESDRDTYILAAHALYPEKGIYYQVKSPASHRTDWVTENITNSYSVPSAVDITNQSYAFFQHDYLADDVLRNNLREMTGARQQEAMDLFRKDWYLHRNNSYRIDRDISEELKITPELAIAFWKEYSTQHTLKDLLAYFECSPVGFVRTDHVKESIELLLDKEKGQQSSPKHDRYYKAQFLELTNYDTDLENWKVLQQLSCDAKNILWRLTSPSFKESANTKVMKEACKFTVERVKYLRSSAL